MKIPGYIPNFGLFKDFHSFLQEMGKKIKKKTKNSSFSKVVVRTRSQLPLADWLG